MVSGPAQPKERRARAGGTESGGTSRHRGSCPACMPRCRRSPRGAPNYRLVRAAQPGPADDQPCAAVCASATMVTARSRERQGLWHASPGCDRSSLLRFRPPGRFARGDDGSWRRLADNSAAHPAVWHASSYSRGHRSAVRGGNQDRRQPDPWTWPDRRLEDRSTAGRWQRAEHGRHRIRAVPH
jgi:hypothetical protein